MLLVICVNAFSHAQIEFQHHTIIDESFNPFTYANTVFSADLDGDGDNDVISGDSSLDQLHWLENIDGEGTFAIPELISDIMGSINSIDANDIDGDGDIDILISSYEINKISWFENTDGNGSFGTERIINLSAIGATSAILIDINNDGDLDVVSTSELNNRIAFYLNIDGLGTFNVASIISSEFPEPQVVKSLDIDNDGFMDLVVGGSAGVNVYRNNNGLQVFDEPYTITNNSIKHLTVGHFNGDQYPDIAIGHFGGEVSWYENQNGVGTFGTSNLIYNNGDVIKKIGAADIDGDNHDDLVIALNSHNKVIWQRNTDGLGTFGGEQTVSINWGVLGSVPLDIHINDINSDGNLDVILASYTNNDLSWFSNSDGLGNFSYLRPISVNANRLEDIIFGDIDGDGDNDVVSVSSDDNEVAWYENSDNNGTFLAQYIITQEVRDASSVYLADLDNDGDLDVVAASATEDSVSWFENLDGQGNFGLKQEIYIATTGSNLESVIVIAFDLDSDNDNDIFSFTKGSTGGSMRVHENLGSGNFAPMQTLYNAAIGYNDVHASDVTGNGLIDFITAGGNEVILWKNTGTGINGDLVYQGGTNAQSVYTSDLDNDGDLDVIVGYYGTATVTSSSRVVWFENTDGQGSFGSRQDISPLFFPNNAYGVTSVYSGDLDNDGDMDVISSSFKDDKIAWYENIDGLGTFSEQKILIDNDDNIYNADPLTDTGAKAVFAVDMDNDGDIDVLSATSNKDAIIWSENFGVLGNEINGHVLLDLNNDGCDVDDLPVNNLLIVTDNGNDSFATFTQDDGSFQIPVGMGLTNVSIQSPLPNSYDSNPTSYDLDIQNSGNIFITDFCLEPTQIFNDLNISVIPSLNPPRPGFDTSYSIIFRNEGTTVLGGYIQFQFDQNKLNFLSANEPLSSQTANTLTFDFGNLLPFETRTIELDFNVYSPPTTDIGDIIEFTATISPILGDLTENDNVFSFEQVVIGAYDPNDITVLEGEQILLEDTDKYLHYIIRFQNTGTAEAINVSVENILDDHLDWNTIQLQDTSHNTIVEIRDGNMVTFNFYNINLPDSTNDEANSHGYIAYKIKPKSNIELGDIIYNTAHIFFDFNPAIITNTVSTEVVETLSIDEVEDNSIFIYPNPTTGILNFGSVDNGIINLKLINNIGQIVFSDTKFNEKSLDLSNYASGVYILILRSDNKTVQKKILKL